MCNQKFNLSSNKTNEIDRLFDLLFSNNLRSNCKVPCTKTKYKARFKSKTPFWNGIAISIRFDQTLDVARSRFSISSLTLLTQVGGHIGVGQTLLWILVSLLGVAQVTFLSLKPFVIFAGGKKAQKRVEHLQITLAGQQDPKARLHWKSRSLSFTLTHFPT